jgi:hypothetical protein
MGVGAVLSEAAMTKRDRIYVLVWLCIGIAIVCAVLKYADKIDAKPMPAILPIQNQIKCPEWKPWLSETVVITVNKSGAQCMRVRMM